jgi:hypothetical protein
MNKIITLSLILMCSLAAIAQDDESRKPPAKAWTTEVNFDPFAAGPVSISYIRLRKFVTEKTAFRMGVSLGLKDETPDKDISRNTFELNLRPGFEWHMVGTDRISPYYGVELDFATKTSDEKGDEDFNEYTVDGAWSNGSERGYTRIGANFIVGVDVYIIKRLYMGTEIGFGFENTKESNVKVKDGDGTILNEDKGGKRMQVGPNFNSSIRLGFVF